MIIGLLVALASIIVVELQGAPAWAATMFGTAVAYIVARSIAKDKKDKGGKHD